MEARLVGSGLDEDLLFRVVVGGGLGLVSALVFRGWDVSDLAMETAMVIPMLKNTLMVPILRKKSITAIWATTLIRSVKQVVLKNRDQNS